MALPSRPASHPSWPRTLRGRLLALVLGALVVAQIVSFWMFLDERSRAVAYAAAEDAAGRALSLAAALDAAPEPSWPGLLRSAGSRWIRFSVDSAPAATETDWRGLRRLAGRLSRSPAGEGRPLRIAMLEADAPWADWRRDRDAEDDRRERHPRDDDEEAPRRLLVSAALADGRWLNGVALARRPPLVWAGAALASAGISAVLLTVAIWVAVGRIARPIDALARAADRLGRGDRPDPLPLNGAQEIRSVAGAFNDMADRLTRLLDERARTLAAIGHDLRSPITAMRLRLEMIDDDETRERIAACVDEMQVLVEAALALARGGGAEEALAPTPLRALLVELAAELREAGHAAELAPGPDIAPPARRAALKRALRNIAENAARYGGVARIALTRAGDGARIVIDDDGPGIAPDDRARVFEPFVRLEESRSRETGGAGLGLAIARAAIEGQGGTIRLEDAPGGGLRAVIELAG